MKNLRLIIPLGITFILAMTALVMLVVIIPVFAQSDTPEGVQIFYLEAEGLTCLLWPDGSGDCYCSCDPVCSEPIETPGPWNSPTPRATPKDTPVPEPTPTSMPDPTKTPKPNCNRGLGNFSENCDPGNSGGKPGAAGEENEPFGPPGQN